MTGFPWGRLIAFSRAASAIDARLSRYMLLSVTVDLFITAHYYW
jgi:hypothetical protein